MDYLKVVACSFQFISFNIALAGGSNGLPVTLTRADGPTVIVPPTYYSDRVLTVTTILIEPYASLRKYNLSKPVSDVNSMYEGYIVDLMDLIASVVGFKYRLIPVYDGTFGYKRPDGSWDGMIGELTRKEADIAAGPMYITEQRHQTVDFTRPFMNIHASMIMRKPQYGGPSTINTVTDLIQHPSMQFGTLNRGIIRKALRTTNSSLYQMLYEKMKSADIYAFTRTNQEGIERVRNENYVYILPDKIADYVSRQKPCDLNSVGSFLIEEHFGLAVPKGSALLTYLNRAIDLLKRQGDLQRIYQKWWLEQGQCPTVQSSKIFSPDKSELSATSRHHVEILLIIITMCITVLTSCV